MSERITRRGLFGLLGGGAAAAVLAVSVKPDGVDVGYLWRPEPAAALVDFEALCREKMDAMRKSFVADFNSQSFCETHKAEMRKDGFMWLELGDAPGRYVHVCD